MEGHTLWTKTKKPPPPIEAGDHTPLTEVEDRPPQAEAVNQLPQGVQLNCPQGQRELVMASHGIKGLSKSLEEKLANAKALHT